MLLLTLAHDANFYQPANSQRVHPSKITRDKTSAMRNVHTHLVYKLSSCIHAQARSFATYFVDDARIHTAHPQCVLVARGRP